MNWVVLILAGLLEVVWALGLKHSAGFTRPTPSAVTIAAMLASFYLLALALKTLPLGTAYAVWVGIGMAGTVIAGALFFGEDLSMPKLASMVLILAGIAGLKLSSGA
jgi:quaternary ammonium compound-resistance protein SugE